MVGSAEDADIGGADGVGADAAEAILGKALFQAMADAGGGLDGEIEGRFISWTVTVDIGEPCMVLAGEGFELGSDAEDEEQADAEVAQNGEFEEEVGEGIAFGDGAVEGDDKGMVSPLGNVFEDAPEVSGAKLADIFSPVQIHV